MTVIPDGRKVATQPFYSIAQGTGILRWDESSQVDVSGFKVSVDGGVHQDVGLPNPVDLGGGAFSYSTSISGLSGFTPGWHIVTVYAYNSLGQESIPGQMIHVQVY